VILGLIVIIILEKEGLSKLDMSAYKDEFISEAKDHFDGLNNDLLALEESPEDADTINRIFRHFHTLKGNSATMGFMKFSEVAHKLEDLLGKVRDKKHSVNKDLMDILFHGCDVLEDGLNDIAEDHSESLDATEILSKLNDMMNVEEKVKISVDINEHIELSDEDRNIISENKDLGFEAFRIVFVFKKDAPLRSAKNMVILRELKSNGNIISINPDEEHLKTELDEFEVVYCTKLNKESVDEKFSKISGLDHINVLGINEGYEKKEKTVEEKHEAKEMEKSKTIAKASTKVVKQVQTVKIDIKRLDHLLNMVGELLISKIRLQQISKKYNIKELDIILASIDRLTLDIQDEVMAERMVPIGNIFNRYPRMVRDLAGKENKKIKFEMEGSEIEFDRTILDEIGDPLVHLLRNSVDHGIEDPDVREDAGKNVFGKIKIKALREKNYAVIQVSDDGAGISPKKIRESSIKKGMLTAEEAEKMSDKQLQYLIFKPGLSTNEVVTSVSGRGVGMDVVESKIRSLGGSLTLDSTPGEGTVITMKLPLTVAIISALLVSVSKQTYAIPLSVVNMTVEIDKEDIKTIQKNKVFLLRGKEIPIVSLHEVFGFEYKDNAKKTLVIVEKSGEHVGLLIDEIIVQQQILIKSLDGLIKGVKGFGGATILGDGAVALIIDVESLI
jgi:two-component system chemotaxis sensor kinase CheA